MKKVFLLISLFMAALISSASVLHVCDIIPLEASIIDPTGTYHPIKKNPVIPPTVFIEDYTLTFEVDHPNYILNIKDEDGNVVFNTTVYSAQTQVVLPSTLSGDYEVELVMGNWLFTGYINL